MADCPTPVSRKTPPSRLCPVLPAYRRLLPRRSHHVQAQYMHLARIPFLYAPDVTRKCQIPLSHPLSLSPALPPVPPRGPRLEMSLPVPAALASTADIAAPRPGNARLAPPSAFPGAGNDGCRPKAPRAAAAAGPGNTCRRSASDGLGGCPGGRARAAAESASVLRGARRDGQPCRGTLEPPGCRRAQDVRSSARPMPPLAPGQHRRACEGAAPSTRPSNRSDTKATSQETVRDVPRVAVCGAGDFQTERYGCHRGEEGGFCCGGVEWLRESRKMIGRGSGVAGVVEAGGAAGM